MDVGTYTSCSAKCGFFAKNLTMKDILCVYSRATRNHHCNYCELVYDKLRRFLLLLFRCLSTNAYKGEMAYKERNSSHDHPLFYICIILPDLPYLQCSWWKNMLLYLELNLFLIFISLKENCSEKNTVCALWDQYRNVAPTSSSIY